MASNLLFIGAFFGGLGIMFAGIGIMMWGLNSKGRDK
jgi:hypothetical protein